MTARKDKPSYMYSFRWNKVSNMAATLFQLERAKAEQVELAYYQDEKVTASDLGYLLVDVGSSQ